LCKRNLGITTGNTGIGPRGPLISLGSFSLLCCSVFPEVPARWMPEKANDEGVRNRYLKKE
jgi:hypothetical protein